MRPVFPFLARDASFSKTSRSLVSTRRVSSTSQPPPEHETLFRYDRARWIWNEEQQLARRYRKFQVDELKKVAIGTVNARSCVSIEKIFDGAQNRVLQLNMDNGRSVVACIPYTFAGPARLTTLSEIATMAFARDILNIPVPEVLAWSGNARNPVGSEFIIMEDLEAAGAKQLAYAWDYELKLPAKIRIAKDFVDIQARLLSTTFKHYGALYFKVHAPPGSVPAVIDGPHPDSVKSMVKDRFMIGPVTNPSFWRGERDTLPASRGPWQTPQEYLEAIVDREIAWLNRWKPPTEKRHPAMPAFKGTRRISTLDEASSQIDTYERFRKMIPFLPPGPPEWSQSVLNHCKLDTGDLYVKDDQLFSVADWQNSWAGPLFYTTALPSFLKLTGEELHKLPENYAELSDEEQTKTRSAYDSTAVFKHFAIDACEKTEVLVDIWDHILSKANFNILPHLVDAGADFNAHTLRNWLMRYIRHWDWVAPDAECPVEMSDEEYSKTMDRDFAEEFNGWQDFWEKPEKGGNFKRDGWVVEECYDDVLELFRELRRKLLGDEEESAEKKAEYEEATRWVLEKKLSTEV
ncbi:Altered inheritance of mitochondria protein 9, mitochondrial [Cercospora beticola]|uniref:Altered inheritance of mitochondria protein 9, mitochondrial n=1 Tax=Cercospora beticola TaxID=122368 RepID=A0A2G5I0V4_CERBT|nr:Altered inheritance of mitochondria protein 9, mitochondrial [Cercospora beticola]PIA98445.1 Altered inheritance of mitochondria protein 9, mitochondrial [Cercospora beticola]WPA98870.1 hypothetical protein RHO25_003483 [Cercospora beticola]CAK1360160.1 unnamed protein product [Cercospora beticola]